MPSPSSLDALMAPRSVAIVGASSDPRRFGGRPIQYLKEAGFAGPVYPINPQRETIQDLRCYPNLGAVDGPIDCAILAVGADATVAAVETCAAKGVKAAIVLSAGFAEIGGEGVRLQREIVEIGRRTGLRVLGPNCMGVFNAHAKFYATFASGLEDGLPPAGRIGLVSQSGGYGGYVLRHARLRGLDLGCWATTGNECDIELGELLGWMAGRAEIDVILAYMEGIRSGPNLIAGLDKARRLGKPVVAMKVGRTAEGRVAAASHTASLTGEDNVYDAVFEAYGVHRARTSDELLDVGYAASRGKLPKGRRVAILSMSGGVGVQLADYVSDAGLTLPATPEPTQAALKKLVPFCSPVNPIDATGQVTADHHLMGSFVEEVLGSKSFDALVIFLGISGSAPSMAEPLRKAVTEACAKFPDQLVFMSITAPPDMVRAYDAAGFLTFEDPSRAVNAMGALVRFAESFAGCKDMAETQPVPQVAAPAGGRFNEVEAKALLAQCGIRTPRERVVETPQAAAAAACEIGFPVAVKVVSADIAHKTEVGGVALGLADAKAVADAVARMAALVPKHLPEARIEGYLVSEMVRGGVETIIGVTRDPTFGPVVTFGLGGTLVELLKDVTCRIAPVSLEEARVMLGQLKTSPLLTGYRGGPVYDTESLAQAIAGVSRLALAPAISGLEVNPAVVMPLGANGGAGGVVALDAVIESGGGKAEGRP